MLVAAILYAAVGHGGASAYIAAMALAGIALERGQGVYKLKRSEVLTALAETPVDSTSCSHRAFARSQMDRK